jgi:uncharacterized membrane protein
LAWVFVAFALVAVVGGTAAIAKEGWPSNWPLRLYLTMGGSVYLFTVFLFVALKGRAPVGWIPWWSREDHVGDSRM